MLRSFVSQGNRRVAGPGAPHMSMCRTTEKGLAGFTEGVWEGRVNDLSTFLRKIGATKQ
jgi:hypothetical protein